MYVQNSESTMYLYNRTFFPRLTLKSAFHANTVAVCVHNFENVLKISKVKRSDSAVKCEPTAEVPFNGFDEIRGCACRLRSE